MPTPSTVLPIPVARPAGLPGFRGLHSRTAFCSNSAWLGRSKGRPISHLGYTQGEIEFGVALSHLLQPSQRVHVQKSKG